MYTLIAQLTATPEPTQPAAEVIRDAVRVLDTFDQLGPLMGLLLVVALALISILIVVFASRNSNSQAINVLAAANTAKEYEIKDLRAQLIEYQRLHVEGLSVIGAQTTRTNDLFDAMNNRSANRDLQQQEIVNTQGRIASAFDRLLSEGSAPLQQVARDVAALITLANSIDSRQSNWEALIVSIPQVKQDIITQLNNLMAELQKRSTKPIPAVDGTTVTSETSPL